MPDRMPAQEIHAAAEMIRAAAAKASRGPWVFYQTVTREDGNDVAWTITRPYCEGGSPGDCDPDCAKDVLQVGAEGCEHDFVSQGDVEWMTLASPSIAEPLAGWLESEANRKHVVSTPHHRGILGGHHGHCSCGDSVIQPDPDAPAECKRLNHALAIARVINGGAA